MATSEEVRQLLAILDDEGFGVVAGEILTEINLGREVEKPVFSPDGVEVHDEKVIKRVFIPDEEQIDVLIEMLRSRLVEPIRAFAEAERIVGDIVEGSGSRIEFIDPEQQVESAPLFKPDFDDTRVGDTRGADSLNSFLERLPELVRNSTEGS